MQVKELIALLSKMDPNAVVEAIAENEELNLNIVEVEEAVPAEDSANGLGLVFLYCTAVED